MTNGTYQESSQKGSPHSGGSHTASDGSRKPIDLRIYFAGLMVVDLGKDRAQSLLVNAREPERLGEKTRGTVPHIPIVQFAWKEAIGDLRPFGCFRDAFGAEKGYWVLDKDIVQLDPNLETAERTLKQSDEPVLAGQTTPHTKDDHESLRWLTPLHAEGGGPAEIKEALLDPLLRSEETVPILASVRMKHGFLRTVAFASEAGNFVLWDFGDGREPRAAASVLEYRVQVYGSSVLLVATKFDGTQGQELELEPSRNGHNGRRLEIWVLNLEWDIVESQRPPRPVQFQRENPELHFYQDVLAKPSTGNGLPRAIKRVPGQREAEGASEFGPVVEPCRDPGMRKLHFPSAAGETANAAACSPASPRG
jgi:hypothetical protein